jgi:hypothetical protein
LSPAIQNEIGLYISGALSQLGLLIQRRSDNPERRRKAADRRAHSLRHSNPVRWHWLSPPNAKARDGEARTWLDRNSINLLVHRAFIDPLRST